MKGLCIEPHYLPSIEVLSVMVQADMVHFDIEAPFRKQTYRNRTIILGPNGPLTLIVPVHFHSDTLFKDVKIDYHQSWIKDHWGAFYSAYGKAPFFDHFGELFHQVWKRQPTFLLDLNMEMMSVCQHLLGKQIITTTEKPKSEFLDLRDHFLPKKSFRERNIYQPTAYVQNFGNTFVPNLSILDLLLCQGPEADAIIQSSIVGPIERFVP